MENSMPATPTWHSVWCPALWRKNGSRLQTVPEIQLLPGKMHSSKNNPSTPVKVDFRIRKKQKCDPHFACSRNAHGHLTREFLRKQAQTKPRGQKEHLNETGLYSYRKTPSVWTDCLGNKMHGTANVQFVLVLLHCHQKLSGFFSG